MSNHVSIDVMHRDSYRMDMGIMVQTGLKTIDDVSGEVLICLLNRNKEKFNVWNTK